MSVKYFAALFVRDVQQATFRVPKIVVERVVHHHADEATHDDRRIHFDQRSFALSFANVCAEKFINPTHKLVEEHLREFVFFECGVEQQPLKLRIVFVVVECAEGERLKDGAIVFALDAVGSHLRRLKLSARARFVIENRGVKLFLGGKVPEDHRLRNAGRLGDFFGGGAAKTSFGKEAYGHREESVAGALPRPFGRCSPRHQPSSAYSISL